MTLKKTYLTKPYRCIFPKLDEPGSYQDQGTPMYSVRILIPKSDNRVVKEISEFVQGHINAQDWPKTVKDKAIKQVLKDKTSDFFLFKDGDEKDYMGHDGHYYINLKKHYKTGPVPCYYPDASPIPLAAIRDEIYGGCWIRLSLSAYCFEKPKTGATLRINEIQKTKDDDPFVRSEFSSVENDFEDVGEEDIPFEDEE